MSAIAMGWVVKHTMTNFLYAFGGEDKKQSSGGPIGDEITQATSRHLGNEFDDLFQEKCKILKIKMEVFDRFADDQNVALRNLGRDLKFCPLDGSLIKKSDTQIEQ